MSYSVASEFLLIIKFSPLSSIAYTSLLVSATGIDQLLFSNKCTTSSLNAGPFSTTNKRSLVSDEKATS